MPRSFRSFLHASSSKRNSRTTSPARLPKDVELPEHIRFLASGFFKCVVCDGRGYYLKSLMGVKTHCQGRRHQMEAAKAKQTPPVEDIPKLQVTSTGHYDRVFRAHSLRVPLSQDRTSEMTFTLSNVSGDCTFRFLRWHGPYLNGELRFLQPPSESEKLVLQPGGSIKLTLQITPRVETTLSFKVYFRLEDLGRKVNPGKYASVVENCPVRISVVGEQKQEETPMEGVD